MPVFGPIRCGREAGLYGWPSPEYQGHLPGQVSQEGMAKLLRLVISPNSLLDGVVGVCALIVSWHPAPTG